MIKLKSYFNVQYPLSTKFRPDYEELNLLAELEGAS